MTTPREASLREVARKKSKAYFRGRTLVVKGPLAKKVIQAAKVCGVTPKRWLRDTLTAAAKAEIKFSEPDFKFPEDLK